MLDKTFDPASVEQRQSGRWDAAEIGRPAGNGTPYTVMMPPPNVTGSLHIGHALNFTLQDVVIRYRVRSTNAARNLVYPFYLSKSES